MTDVVQTALITQTGVLVMFIVSRLLSRIEHMDSKNVLNEIKHDVNSSKANDTSIIKENTATILRLSQEVSALKENLRNKDSLIAVSAPLAQTPPAPGITTTTVEVKHVDTPGVNPPIAESTHKEESNL